MFIFQILDKQDYRILALKQELKNLGAKTSGSKAVLIERYVLLIKKRLTSKTVN